MSEQISLARRMMELVDDGRPDRLGEVLAPDCEFVHPMASLRGPEQIAGFLQAAVTAFPGMKHEVHSAVQSGDVVTIEATWTGTHSGPLATPTGDVAPTGRTAVVPLAGVFHVSNARITSVHWYSDQLALMTQLGLLPASVAG